MRIGKLDGDFVVNPEEETLEELEMDLIVSGTDEAILMVECGANGVTEAEVLDALDIAHERDQEDLSPRSRSCAQKAGKEKLEVEAPKIDEGLLEQIRSSHGAKLDEATQIPEKLERQEAIDAVEEEVLGAATRRRRRRARPTRSGAPRSTRAFDAAREGHHPQGGSRSTRSAPTAAPRTRSGRSSARSTSRRAFTARRCSPAARPRSSPTSRSGTTPHGHAGRQPRPADETKTFWHHYNFPPFSVGEAGFMRGPKRRDIGHGALAERALVPTIPSEEDFPYVIRVVSETLESNGSSSMGSVCASSMALQAAGVPVAARSPASRWG